ncbi:MAG: HupE/UreJ family protein [bacterium]|nr:HupE/UreJ family protein [bacterium]
MMRRLRLITYRIVLGILLSLVGVVHAHDPGLSAAALRMTDSELTAHLTFARRELESLVPIDADHDGSVSAEEFAIARPHLDALAARLIEVRDGGLRIAAQITAVELDASDALHFYLRFPCQTGSQLRLSAPIIAKLARGHRQYVSIRDASGDLIADRMLDADHAVFDLPLANAVVAKAVPSFRQFLRLGVAHIVTGYDHLLFLFGLLVVGSSFWSAWRIITSFTVAHSITLALATFDMVQLPPSVVEPLIAVSIIYVGLENLFRRDLHRRWLLTFGFGLVHGLGFASVLRDLGIGAGGSSGDVVPLLAFNFGVELGQISIALLVLPLMWQAQRLPQFLPRFAISCSIFVMLAGTYWLFERTIMN